MRSSAALCVALHASLLALLLAQRSHKAREGAHRRSPHTSHLADRATGHHLPPYMVHLYRNFKSNLSRPADALEQHAERQADTVRSVMARGNPRSFLLILWRERKKYMEEENPPRGA